MNTQESQITNAEKERKEHLSKRIDSIGWGLFLVMIGCLWLGPAGWVPEGTWLIGTGVIILVLTLVRYRYELPISTFWVVFGIIALGIGITSLFGVNFPILAILVIIIGASVIFRPHGIKREK